MSVSLEMHLASVLVSGSTDNGKRKHIEIFVYVKETTGEMAGTCDGCWFDDSGPIVCRYKG